VSIGPVLHLGPGSSHPCCLRSYTGLVPSCLILHEEFHEGMRDLGEQVQGKGSARNFGPLQTLSLGIPSIPKALLISVSITMVHANSQDADGHIQEPAAALTLGLCL
jgi:hypothetical protein